MMRVSKVLLKEMVTSGELLVPAMNVNSCVTKTVETKFTLSVAVQ